MKKGHKILLKEKRKIMKGELCMKKKNNNNKYKKKNTGNQSKEIKCWCPLL